MTNQDYYLSLLSIDLYIYIQYIHIHLCIIGSPKGPKASNVVTFQGVVCRCLGQAALHPVCTRNLDIKMAILEGYLPYGCLFGMVIFEGFPLWFIVWVATIHDAGVMG